VATGSRTKNRMGKAEQARATRRRIVTAATELFLRDGFLTTTMAAIAAQAGVAVQTLYLSFANKTAILSAAFDVALAGDDEPVPLPQRAWMRTVADSRDGVAALTAFIGASGAIIERASPLYGVIRAAAADPELAEILARNKKERHETYASVTKVLAGKPGFTDQLSETDATGVLYAVQSEEMYALFVEEHGWTSEKWREWSATMLAAQLFPKRRLRR
jgi:AcrR family transcriptional regulator